MFSKSIIKISVVFVFALFFLTACGGGSSDDKAETKTEVTGCELGTSIIGSCNL